MERNIQKIVKVYIPDLKNAGDLFNYDLLEYFHIKVEPVRIAANAELLMLGGAISSLQNPERPITDDTIHIWGLGFLYGDDLDESLCRPNLIVHALRGQLSKEKLSGLLGKDLPIDLPLADPGLMASILAGPNEDKRYSIGFIPHYRELDTQEVTRILNANKSMHFIDITQSPTEVIREIQQCETIVSSSLHSLVFSDSLHIPNVHVRLTEIPKGGSYKFRDYYSAFNLVDPALKLDDILTISSQEIINGYKVSSVEVEEKKRQLIASFPACFKGY